MLQPLTGLHTVALVAPMTHFRRSYGRANIVLLILIALFPGMQIILRFYVLAVKKIHEDDWTGCLKYISLSLAIGSGLGENSLKAVLEAPFGRISEFKTAPTLGFTVQDRHRLKGI